MAHAEDEACQQHARSGRGETRLWIEDGDEIIFRGRASRAGHVAIGFGECRGRLDPAVPWPS